MLRCSLLYSRTFKALLFPVLKVPVEVHICQSQGPNILARVRSLQWCPGLGGLGVLWAESEQQDEEVLVDSDSGSCESLVRSARIALFHTQALSWCPSWPLSGVTFLSVGRGDENCYDPASVREVGVYFCSLFLKIQSSVYGSVFLLLWVSMYT